MEISKDVISREIDKAEREYKDALAVYEAAPHAPHALSNLQLARGCYAVEVVSQHNPGLDPDSDEWGDNVFEEINALRDLEREQELDLEE